MKRIKQWIATIRKRRNMFNDFDFAEWERDLSEEV